MSLDLNHGSNRAHEIIRQSRAKKFHQLHTNYARKYYSKPRDKWQSKAVQEQEERERVSSVADSLLIGASSDPKILRMVHDEAVERGYANNMMMGSTNASFMVN